MCYSEHSEFPMWYTVKRFAEFYLYMAFGADLLKNVVTTA